MPNKNLMIFPLLASIVLSACGGSSAPTNNGIDKLNATAAESSVTKAILGATSVRMVIKVQQGTSSSSQVLDAAKTGGIRTVTILGQTATILVTPTNAYVKAPEAILASNFGLPVNLATQDANKWLIVPSGSSGYTSLASGVTMSNLAQSVGLSGVTKKAHANVAGTKVIELDGTSVGGKLGLVVPTVGSPLPISGIISGTSIAVNLQFSNWNQTVNLTPPASAIPFPTAPASPTTTAPTSPSTSAPASPTTSAAG
ncbi:MULTISPECIES: hypothetical protein [Acidithrix]|nr:MULTISPECIES: hypothetical protein [Acidithrix]